jgi:hypothetical protein
MIAATAADVAPRRRLLARTVGQFLPAHIDQKSEQALGLVQLILTEGRADEEAGKDRLRNIH